jgi:hypothetical protein
MSKAKFKVPILLLLTVFSFTLPPDEGLKKILDHFTLYYSYFQQEKVYLHLDKPVYANGEDLWLKAYVVDASFHLPDTISKVLYVELVDSDQKVLRRIVLPIKNGEASGDFVIGDDIKEGNYQIRAYTNNMKNLDLDFLFTKEIQVVNSTMPSSSASPTQFAIDMQFFPEGGQLLAGIENRVGFKVVDQYGKGIQTEGEIVDEAGNTITRFKSKHIGMGMLSFTPKIGKSYSAIINGRSDKILLPSSEQQGFTLRVVDAGQNMKVSVFHNIGGIAENPRKVYLVAQSRGRIGFAAEAIINKSYLTTLIAKEKFPTGISQVTLFDENYMPLSERLFFINHHDQLTADLRLDKGSFKKRDSVVVELNVEGKNAVTKAGNFSIAVYDSRNIQSSEEYPSSIVSYLLLSSDLKGIVESPGYYFKDTLATTFQDLDLLMMTQGWRRFSWKKIMKDTLEDRRFYPEKGLVISGTLYKTLPKRPAAESQVKLITKNGDIMVAKTNKQGEFYINTLDYYDSLEMAIQTDNSKGKKTVMDVLINPFTPSPGVNYHASPFTRQHFDEFLKNNSSRNQVNVAIQFDKKVIQLKEVQVTADRPEEKQESTLYGRPDASIKMSDIPQGYTDIFQVLSGRVAGLYVSGGYPNVSVQIRGGGVPLFLLNGMQTELQDIASISPSFVDHIDVLMGASASIYGGRGGNGVIAIYTKKGQFNVGPTYGISTIKYPGYYRSREFYSPKYASQDKNAERPDLRSTLFWNPHVATNATGKARVSFYTSDISSTYRIVVEGLSEDGLPLYAVKEFEVVE